MKILVLNCYSRNSLAVINGLDPQYEIIGGVARKEKYLLFKPDSFFKSRRLKTIIRYTDPTKDPEGFKNDIIRACERYNLDAIIPTGTTTTNYLSLLKEEINKQHTNTTLLVEHYSTLSRLADKWHTYKICLEANVPAPKTILFNPDEQTLSLLDSFKFPLIIKPRISYAAKGVRFFNSKEELVNHLKNFGEEYNANGSSFIVQEFIEGELRDVTSCSKCGSVISMLSQQRLVSLYDFGGGGIINKTTYEPIPMKYAENIIKHIKWNGVMLFDFIKNREGEYYLLECNPKIWGTTQLTIEAGFNVAQQLIDVFVLNKEIKRSENYEIDLLYKWFFPECVYHWFHNPRTLSRIRKRVINTLRTYNAKRSINNLNAKNLLHLMGIIMDKGEL